MGDGWSFCDFDLTHHCAASARGGGGESSGWQIDPRNWPLVDKSTSTVWKISDMWLPIMLRLRKTMETMWHRCSRRRSGWESRVREWREAESRIPGAPTSSVSVCVFSNSFLFNIFTPRVLCTTNVLPKPIDVFFRLMTFPFILDFPLPPELFLLCCFVAFPHFFCRSTNTKKGGRNALFKQSRKVFFKEFLVLQVESIMM